VVKLEAKSCWFERSVAAAIRTISAARRRCTSMTNVRAADPECAFGKAAGSHEIEFDLYVLFCLVGKLVADFLHPSVSSRPLPHRVQAPNNNGIELRKRRGESLSASNLLVAREQ
jgi:hypothetical protein